MESKIVLYREKTTSRLVIAISREEMDERIACVLNGGLPPSYLDDYPGWEIVEITV